jgi:hypothetical protein
VDELLAGAALAYFDGRLTEAALLVARRARQLGVPVRCTPLWPALTAACLLAASRQPASSASGSLPPPAAACCPAPAPQVLAEAERLRPGLELLLAEADYVVTSGHFPQAGGRGGHRLAPAPAPPARLG